MKKKKNIYTCTKYFISILPSQNISFPFHTKVTEIPVAVQHSHNPIIVSCNFRMLSITNSSQFLNIPVHREILEKRFLMFLV